MTSGHRHLQDTGRHKSGAAALGGDRGRVKWWKLSKLEGNEVEMRRRGQSIQGERVTTSCDR